MSDRGSYLQQIHSFGAQTSARPKKRLGQNFLVDEKAHQAIAHSLEISSSDTVLEIGPGLGFLTEQLLGAGQLILVEKDVMLAQRLRDLYAKQAHVRVVEGDILKQDEDSLGLKGPVKVAGNIPYYITSPILEWIIDHRKVITRAALTMQKEVAQRLMAQVGTKAWGSLSVFVNTYAEICHVYSMPKACFYPSPKVDSCALSFALGERFNMTALETEIFSCLCRGSFQKRRKTMANALTGLCCHGKQLQKSQALELLQAQGLDARQRPETITLRQWVDLASEFARMMNLS